MEFAAFGLMLIACVVMLVAVIWQIVEAFKLSGTGWGIASILGMLCLGLIPNLIWVLMNWQKGWPMLVTYFAGLPPMFIAIWIMMMESLAQAAAGG